jgi:hypothetical protein
VCESKEIPEGGCNVQRFVVACQRTTLSPLPSGCLNEIICVRYTNENKERRGDAHEF